MPEAPGLPGLAQGAMGQDAALPGFGPFGTAGAHCFTTDFPTYRRIAAFIALRQQFPVLRQGRQYPRPISNFGMPFTVAGPGEIVAWSRILNDEEALCVVNAHGRETRGGNILVDAALNPPGSAMTVKVNSQETANGSPAGVSHPIGSRLPVRGLNDGTAFLEIRGVQPSEVLVLVNHP